MGPLAFRLGAHFCGGLDFIKLINKYRVSDKVPVLARRPFSSRREKFIHTYRGTSLIRTPPPP